jgi:hypothetical protein
MRGGPATLTGKNGSMPVHLAVKMKSVDCMMVLINIGVDLNSINSFGFTPRFLARSERSVEIEQLLAENNAEYVVEEQTDGPDRTVLDVVPGRGVGSEFKPSSSGQLEGFLGLPKSSSTY